MKYHGRKAAYVLKKGACALLAALICFIVFSSAGVKGLAEEPATNDTAASQESKVYYRNGEETVDYYIPDFEVSFGIPIKYYCITREADATNAFFRAFPVDPERMAKQMTDNGIYLDAVSMDASEEISIVITGTGGLHLDDISDPAFATVLKSVEESFAAMGARDITSAVYQGEKESGISVHYCIGLGNIIQYVVQYSMTHNDYLINVRLHSMNKPITETQEQTLQGVFNSAEWGRRE